MLCTASPYRRRRIWEARWRRQRPCMLRTASPYRRRALASSPPHTTLFLTSGGCADAPTSACIPRRGRGECATMRCSWPVPLAHFTLTTVVAAGRSASGLRLPHGPTVALVSTSSPQVGNCLRELEMAPSLGREEREIGKPLFACFSSSSRASLLINCRPTSAPANHDAHKPPLVPLSHHLGDEMRADAATARHLAACRRKLRLHSFQARVEARTLGRQLVQCSCCAACRCFLS